MRIRKHAKISPLLYAPSSLKLQTHVCQLNQSPWDAMTFSPPSSPPPPFQVDGSDARAGNGSSDHRVSVSERRSEYLDAAVAAPLESGTAVIYCCKTDGKSWQCRREAEEGNSKCEHHLSLVKSYSSTAAKKSVKPSEAAVVTEAPRRTRPKKAPAAASSNPCEFYYYTGFGPRWGKVRGETDSKHEGFVYEDDDSEEDEDDDRVDGKKKRMRKPIKARSLKSLF
ncbi:hypothetical protein SASPL_116361 [Salvia splendens]|uniref:WRC domain-containing protein n=1 Tax=Salvia splendens TaxID=180675 RepID=A0A8X8ZXX1_SALSN|nr:uncharacterized protein LOC121807298 [Salvia splendens]KAG6419849.1 hypothetical protein SASPL_116361 [Salvia splendens]